MVSYIYVICEKDKSPVKIGFSADPHKRLKQLQTGHPFALTLHHFEEVEDKSVKILEKIIHKENKHHRMTGEWFNLSPMDAISEIKHALIRYGDQPDLRNRFKSKLLD